MLKEFLEVQIPWSIATFGADYKPKGILDHMRSEMIEVEAAPDDLEEWIDLVHLAFDGAARCGGGKTPDEIINMLLYKQQKNHKRKWHPPDENGFTRHVKEDSELD